MKTIQSKIILSVLVFLLSSCSIFSSQPTETPVPTSTNTPIPTATVTMSSIPTSTNTPKPTFTSTIIPEPSATQTEADFVLPSPVGVPAADWKGIPVMPGAIAGEGDDAGYSFTIDALPDDIQSYYEEELAQLGWSELAVGEGTTGSLIIIFTQGESTASVSVIPQPDGLMYVLLVKS